MVKQLVTKSLSMMICSLALVMQPLAIDVASAETLTVASAINKAGRQRMLTQRIAKNYMLIGIEVAPEKAQQELDDSVALFESQLLELKEFAPDETINNNLAKVEDLWADYRLIAINSVNKPNAEILLATNGELLAACHQVVLDIEALSDKGAVKMVNLAGRQRMLSQRMALQYMAWVWGFQDDNVMNDLIRSQQDFEVAMETMLAFAGNTPELTGKLEKVEAQWRFTKAGFSRLGEGHYVPSVIRTTTNSMLKKMNVITQLYEDLSNQ